MKALILANETILLAAIVAAAAGLLFWSLHRPRRSDPKTALLQSLLERLPRDEGEREGDEEFPAAGPSSHDFFA
jgi:hypothetical protein